MAAAFIRVLPQLIEFMAVGQGLISTLDGAISKSAPAADSHIVQIYAGEHESSDLLSGDQPGVALWNYKGDNWGSTWWNGNTIKSGNHREIEVKSSAGKGNSRAEYLALAAGGNDALCISGIVVKHPSGPPSVFSGDVAVACGADWYESRTMLQDGTVPKCFWIDGDYSNGLKHNGIGIHLPSFNTETPDKDIRAKKYSDNRDLMCKVPARLKMYTKLNNKAPITIFDPVAPPSTMADADVLSHKTKNTQTPNRKRDMAFTNNKPASYSNSTIPTFSNSTTPRLNNLNATTPMNSRVVVSSKEWSSARNLCESSTSRGPSFVSVAEGLFCDMEDKSLWFTCDNKDAPSSKSCCYDTKVDTLLACDKKAPISTLPKDLMNVPIGFTGFTGSRAFDEIATGIKQTKDFDMVERW